MKMKTVLVSTDEPLVEIGINTLLGSDPDFKLLRVCRTHQDLIAASQLLQPDVIVCGLRRWQFDARRAVVLSVARVQMRSQGGNDAAAEQSRLRLLVGREIA